MNERITAITSVNVIVLMDEGDGVENILADKRNHLFGKLNLSLDQFCQTSIIHKFHDNLTVTTRL